MSGWGGAATSDHAAAQQPADEDGDPIMVAGRIRPAEPL
jgi:hypothetical protein